MKSYFIKQWQSTEAYFEKNLKPTFYFCFAFFGVMTLANVVLFMSSPELSKTYFNEIQTLFNGKAFLNSTGIELWLGIFF